jgi:diguanylate cyclase (GGDEF)-like protein/PAS domain S-box-containing protein
VHFILFFLERNDEAILQAKAVKKNIRLLFYPLLISLMCLSTVLFYNHLKTTLDLDQNHTLVQQSIEIITVLVTNNYIELMAMVVFYLLAFCISSIVYQKVIKIIDHIDQEHQDLSKFKLIVDHSPNAVFISSADNIIQYCNPQGRVITGYEEEQIIGNKTNKWSAKQHLDISYEDIIATCQAGNIWRGELLNRHRSGRYYWAQTALFPVKSTNGDISHFITIEQDITEQKNHQDKIRFLANHDTLTGLPSLRLGKDRLEQAILAATRHQLTMALMFVDLDGFKQVNDKYGHEAGDLVLKEVGQRMVYSTRTTDTIARVGGDEFMVVLTNVKEPAAISRVATKMLNRIKEPYHYQENELFIGASIGIVLCPDQGQSSALLLHKADKAMYQVKNSGKNNFAYYQEESIDPEN